MKVELMEEVEEPRDWMMSAGRILGLVNQPERGQLSNLNEPVSVWLVRNDVATWVRARAEL